MAAVSIYIQFLKGFDHPGTQGVEVNVAYQLLEIGIFLAQNGFVTV